MEIYKLKLTDNNRIGCGTLILFQAIMLSAGSIIHLWTAYLALVHGGILSLFISFILPILSEIFWFFVMWSITGTVLNTYSMIVLVYLSTLSILGLAVYRSVKAQIHAFHKTFDFRYGNNDVPKRHQPGNVYVLEKDQYSYEPEKRKLKISGTCTGGRYRKKK